MKRTALIEAIQLGDLALVESTVAADATARDRLHHDMTPLMWACSLHQAPVVARLLDLGADPRAASDDGETALHLAAFEAMASTVQALLDHGADVDAATDTGKTPLMNAAQSGSLASIDLLLAERADPRLRDHDGRTCLHWAVVGEHNEARIIRRLVEVGADREGENLRGLSALEYARVLGRTQIIAALTPRATS